MFILSNFIALDADPLLLDLIN